MHHIQYVRYHRENEEEETRGSEAEDVDDEDEEEYSGAETGMSTAAFITSMTVALMYAFISYLILRSRLGPRGHRGLEFLRGRSYPGGA